MHPPAGQYVGIDVGKHELAVAVRPAGIAFVVPNTAQGYASLLRRIGPTPASIVREATGRYHRALHMTLITVAAPAAVINPSRIHGVRISEGIQAKTDGLGILARFAEQKRPAPTPLPTLTRLQVTDLVPERGLPEARRYQPAGRPVGDQSPTPYPDDPDAHPADRRDRG